MHDVRIALTGPGRGEIYLDGVKQKNVSAVRLDAAVNQVTSVELTLLATKVDVDASGVDVITAVAVRPRRAPSYFEYCATRPFSRQRAQSADSAPKKDTH